MGPVPPHTFLVGKDPKGVGQLSPFALVIAEHPGAWRAHPRIADATHSRVASSARTRAASFWRVPHTEVGMCVTRWLTAWVCEHAAASSVAACVCSHGRGYKGESEHTPPEGV